MSLTDFESTVHQCTMCRDYGFEVVKPFPVLSFGDLKDKPVLVVGLNPSSREYEGYLSSSEDPQVRHMSQMDYFNKKPYTFFDRLGRFFNGPARKALQWKQSPWEKVGVTDMVKCPTRNQKGQWSAIKPSEKKHLTEECKHYLFHQINHSRPKVVIAYGSDVCRLFNPYYTAEKAFTSMDLKIDATESTFIMVPQVQGAHPPRIIELVQQEIADGVNKLT